MFKRLICKRQKLKQPKCPSTFCITISGILLSNKERQITDTLTKLEESKNMLSKRIKIEDILYVSTYIQF